ncbi:ferritin-like domain-containing protein [Gemmatimonas sp.]|uniref:ferritin-like domain-containing protein n=1 Tax=Gemmatimonas sp. TaxID=1962908 RepID=UPI003568828A
MIIEARPILESIDPEILATLAARENEIAQGASTSSSTAALLALGSIPIALGALARDAYAQAPSDVLDVLQFALLLEYLEAEFYQRGVAASGLIDAADRTIFTTISGHETIHVTALRSLISAKGATPLAKPNFDFTAKGNVAGFNFAAGQYETFKVLAMAFEDTGVRAYKGQAPRLIGDAAALSAALSIHSVEARHAAEIRRLRGKKAWISGSSRDDLPAFTQGIYAGEENELQGGLMLSTLPGYSANGGSTAGTEAFDEPLSKAEVTAIITPFLA